MGKSRVIRHASRSETSVRRHARRNGTHVPPCGWGGTHDLTMGRCLLRGTASGAVATGHWPNEKSAGTLCTQPGANEGGGGRTNGVAQTAASKSTDTPTDAWAAGSIDKQGGLGKAGFDGPACIEHEAKFSRWIKIVGFDSTDTPPRIDRIRGPRFQPIWACPSISKPAQIDRVRGCVGRLSITLY